MNQERGKTTDADDKANRNANKKGVAVPHKFKLDREFLANHEASLILFFIGGILAPVAMELMSKRSKVWCAGVGVWCLLGVPIALVCRSIVVYMGDENAAPPSPITHPHSTTSESTAHSANSDEQRATFQQLGQMFRTLAAQSEGLYHVLIEYDDAADGEFPPMIHPIHGTPLKHPNDTCKWDNPPSDPVRVTELSEVESNCAPPPSEGEKYVRDARGRARAVWQPSAMRFGYLYGDSDVINKAHDVSEAVGQAMLGVPDDVLMKLPENYRFLFRARTSGNNRSSAWVLLMHRMGWDAPAGSVLRATRWYWKGNTTLSYGFRADHSRLNLSSVPRNRFFSVFGDNADKSPDFCLASAWAVDRLILLLDSSQSEKTVSMPTPAASIVTSASSPKMPAAERAHISKNNPGRSFEVVTQQVGNWMRGTVFTEYELRRSNPAPQPNPGADPATATDDYYEEILDRLLKSNPPAIRLIPNA